MFNLFETNTDDIQFLINNAGKDVLINDIAKKALITNPGLYDFEDRHISTLDKLSRGDLVTYDNEKYLVITESISKRGGKYKALMRHCNNIVQIPGETKQVPKLDENGNPVYDRFGDPVYITIQTDPTNVPAIVDNKSFSIDSNYAIRVPENQIVVTLQDNELNNRKIKVNFVFTMMGKKWKVVNVDLTKNGLMILTCEFTAS
ncbi:hypothetical protein [Fictibacillus gelatini]|uniref:hypothetical protein n=1 Tax=Fictibacillus gelatini TaxID=225985 RepID=UPI000411F1DC|nr:hypothetical protein [Fictibacillus gelatini]